MDGHHKENHDGNRTMWTSDSSGSRSSQDSDSTPRTPPSPVLVPTAVELPIVEPHITMTPTSSPVPSPQKANRSPKRVTTPKSRLGAIDEHTDKMSPDVPLRDPRRLLRPTSKLFTLPTLYGTRRAPKGKWDDVEGPNGEKFSDLRNNRKNVIAGRGGWRRFICIGLVILAVGLIVAIILLAVLLTRHNRKQNNNNVSNDVSSPASDTFPAGTFRISSYLVTESTGCTSNAATWTCYPSTTYAGGASASLSNLTWVIAKTPNTDDWTITSQDTIFNYPFTSVPLNLENKGANNEAYVFTYTYSKPTFPETSLTTSNTRSKCYFNNTVLSGRLFTKMQKVAALKDNSNQWPYALEFSESVSSGANVPDCYEYVNAQNGNHIDVSTGASGARCQCAYTNYNV